MTLPAHKTEAVLQATREVLYEYIPPIARNSVLVREAVATCAHKILEGFLSWGWEPPTFEEEANTRNPEKAVGTTVPCPQLDRRDNRQ